MNNPVFIPLGTRCSTATILNIHFKKRLFSLPFDWIDLPIRNISQFIDIEKGKQEEFTINYFKNVKLHTQRHVDNTWFPHDLHTVDFPENEVMGRTLEKYIRRMKRLHDVLETSESFVFFTTCAVCGSHGNLSDFNKLKSLIEGKVNKPSIFVSINLENYNFVEGNHYNFHIPITNKNPLTGQDFADWEINIVSAINSNEFLSSIFKG